MTERITKSLVPFSAAKLSFREKESAALFCALRETGSGVSLSEAKRHRHAAVNESLSFHSAYKTSYDQYYYLCLHRTQGQHK